MDCVLFSGYCPRQRIGEYYNDYMIPLLSAYSDCDVIVGLSPQGFTRIRPLQNELISIAPESRIVDSDVTGYQEALRVLKHSGKVYDKVYFIHTKGISYYDNTKRKEAREKYLYSFFRSRAEINDVLKNPFIGSWCHTGRLKDPTKDLGYFNKICDTTFNFTHPWSGIECLFTLYCIKYDILQRFFEGTDDSFFERNLVDIGHNRYFFEHIFPTITDRYGYYPYVKEFWDYNRETHLSMVSKWNPNFDMGRELVW